MKKFRAGHLACCQECADLSKLERAILMQSNPRAALANTFRAGLNCRAAGSASQGMSATMRQALLRR